MSKNENLRLLDFIAEAGMLKRVNRSGWTVLGLKDAETVAEHSFRCTVIAYILALMEKVSSHRVLLMALFNDMHEARINDLHKMSQRYYDVQKAEDTAFKEQIDPLPARLRKELASVYKEYRQQNTRESVIARDADILECLIQAKEFYEQGVKQASRFMKKAPRFLKTKSAQDLWRLAKTTSLNEWWEKLSEFKR